MGLKEILDIGCNRPICGEFITSTDSDNMGYRKHGFRYGNRKTKKQKNAKEIKKRQNKMKREHL